MKKDEFYFDLPEELIAQHPLKNREKSRLLVLNKETGDIQHKNFTDIVDYFSKGDCLVLNDTRVIPARLYGHKEPTGSKIEFLLLKRIEGDKWETLVKPGKKAKIGTSIVFGEGLLRAKVIDFGDGGTRIVQFYYDGIFQEVLDKLGEMPLPPYIKEKLDNSERYQTVYSKKEGSAAAPTAGLHFTHELLKKIKEKGVNIVYITVHVGLGTFRPVKVENIEDHKMHAEYYEISSEVASVINKTKRDGGKIFAVGTTTTRTLESNVDDNGLIKAGNGWTDIFIYPGHKVKSIDCLITNFHLPESTLIMLISAIAGKDKIFKAYREAVKEKYRFFSFGDSMLII